VLFLTKVLHRVQLYKKQKTKSCLLHSVMHSIGTSFIVLFVIVLNSCLATPLDDYVNTLDPMFSWTRLETYPQSTYTIYVLNMTSQQWFDGTVIFYKMLIIHLFYRFIIFTTNLVALFGDYSSKNDSSS
jgi:hypothetical protein